MRWKWLVVVQLVGAPLAWWGGARLRAPIVVRAEPPPAPLPCENEVYLQAEVNDLRAQLTAPLDLRLDVQARRAAQHPPSPDQPPPDWVYEADVVWAALHELPVHCRPSVTTRGTLCDPRDGCGIVFDGVLNVRRIGQEGTPPACAAIWDRARAVYGPQFVVSGGSEVCLGGLTGTAYRVTPVDLRRPDQTPWRMPDCMGRVLGTCRDGLEAARERLAPDELVQFEAAFTDNEAMVRRWGCGV